MALLFFYVNYHKKAGEGLDNEIMSLRTSAHCRNK